MYEIFEKLLKEKGITAYRVAKETGVTTSTLTCWKKGKYTPKREKLEKIADYLGVSVEYLINGKAKEDSTEASSYEIFEHLLQKHGVSAYKVAKETGVTQSTLSDWKRGKSTPKTSNLQKIADYFGVSLDYLTTGREASKEDTWNPQLTSADEKDIAKKMTAIIGDLTDGKEALMFNGEPLDDESKELLKQSLENSLRMAKVIAKRKYTPKKYRKNGSDDGENPN